MLVILTTFLCWGHCLMRGDDAVTRRAAHPSEALHGAPGGGPAAATRLGGEINQWGVVVYWATEALEIPFSHSAACGGPSWYTPGRRSAGRCASARRAADREAADF